MEYKLIAPRQDGTNLLTQVLLNRGFKSIEDINHFLTTDENDLQDPLLLDNMREGVELLIRHIRENSKTLIIVD